MLSRRRSQRLTRHLRRARSCDSQIRRSDRSSEASCNGDEEAHHQALTAAEIAYEREHQHARLLSSSCNPGGGEKMHGGLRRTQSVRFAGPNATPILPRSITRRQAMRWDTTDSRSVTSDVSSSSAGIQSSAFHQNDQAFLGSIQSTPPPDVNTLREADSCSGAQSSHRALSASGSKPTPSRVSSRLQRLAEDESDIWASNDPSERSTNSFADAHILVDVTNSAQSKVREEKRKGIKPRTLARKLHFN